MSPQSSFGIVASLCSRVLFVLPLLATALPAQALEWHLNPANGHMYTRTTAKMTWTDAEDLALSLGGHLATVRNRLENEWLAATFGTGRLAYIGLNDVAEEGTFVWSSGEPVTFTAWNPGEPNNVNDEDFVLIFWPPGGWNDGPGKPRLAIIEVGETPEVSEVRLTANDAAEGDNFGSSVAVSGDTVLIGAPADDDAGEMSGSVYVFVRNGANWIQQAKLVASDASLEDEFGVSVALSGDTAVIGADHDDDDGSNSGSVYVFVRNGTIWTEQAKLVASDAFAEDEFGSSVSLGGDTVLIGANKDDDAGSASGSAYVFVRSGTDWTEQAKLVASDAAAGDWFGFSVALDQDTALIGSVDDDAAGNFSGSAYVFVRSDTTWTEQAKLIASDGAVSDAFGWSVALSGDTALLGAFLDDDAGLSSGSAYVFVRNDTIWTEQAKLTASDAASQDWFGASVALSGDTALVAARFHDYPVIRSGSVYVFGRSGTSWVEQARLVASDAETFDEFGYSVALSGSTVLVGARGSDSPRDSGSAYVTQLELTPAQVSQFGAGCPGTLAVPTLQSAQGSTPRIGGTFEVVLSDLPTSNHAFLLLGFSNVQWLSQTLPMSLADLGAPGCDLLISNDLYTAVANPFGTATLGLSIPFDPSLVGLHIYIQGYVEDPGANVLGVAVSNGLDITIGSF